MRRSNPRTGRLRCLLLLVLAAGPAAAASGPPRVFASHDVTLGGFAYRSTGDDPQLWFEFSPPLPSGGRRDVVFEMNSEVEGAPITVGQIFFSADPSGDFREELSAKFAVVHDGNWHRYRVAAPAKMRLASLRLDPVPDRSRFRLRRLEVVPPAPARTNEILFPDSAIAIEWLPGPGLRSLGGGDYRVVGRDAYLLAPASLAVDAERFTQIEIRSSTSRRSGRLCYGPGQLDAETGCIALPPGVDRMTTRYVSLLLNPGWSGTIRRLRLEPLGSNPSIGEVVRLREIRLVALQTGPASTLFVRKADLFRRLNPVPWIRLILVGLGVAAILLTLVMRAVPRWRASRLDSRLGGAVDSLLLAGLVGLPLLLMFPFEFYPLFNASFLHGRADLPELLVVFVALLALHRRLFSEADPSWSRRIELLIASFLIAAYLSCLFSEDVARSFAFLERHYLPVLLLFFAAVRARWSRSSLRRYLVLLLCLGTFQAIVGILQSTWNKGFLYGPFFSSFQPLFYYANLTHRPYAAFGHPVPLATFLLLVIPIALYCACWERRLVRLLGFVAFPSMLGCLLLTRSRGALLAWLLSTPLLLRGVPGKARRWLVGLLLLAVLLGVFLSVRQRPRGDVKPLRPAAEERGRSIWASSSGSQIFILQRIQGARIALAIAMRYPLLGAGFGRTRDLYDSFLPAGVIPLNPIWSTVDNQYLTLLAEGGVVGLSIFLLMLAGLARTFLRAEREGRLLAPFGSVSLASASFHLAFYEGLHWVTPSLFGALILGFFFVSCRGARNIPRGQTHPRS